MLSVQQREDLWVPGFTGDLSFSLPNLREGSTLGSGCGVGSPTPTWSRTEKEADISRKLAVKKLLCYQDKVSSGGIGWKCKSQRAPG